MYLKSYNLGQKPKKMKDEYYFPHFCHARHDLKIKRLKKDLGIEGYGIFFMLLEVLREQSSYKYPLSDIDLLADEIGTSEAKLMAVISKYNLFIIDEDRYFYSTKLIEYLQPYLRMKMQRSLAGKASAERRKSILLLPLNDRSTTVEQSKVKESKVKESKECVDELTPHTQVDYFVFKNKDYNVLKIKLKEHETLLQGFGEEKTALIYEKLYLYSINNKKKFQKYKSHYAAIRQWVIRAVEEDLVVKNRLNNSITPKNTLIDSNNNIKMIG